MEFIKENIKILAKEKNMTLNDVAEQAGMSNQNLYKQLRTKRISLVHLENIAKILGVSLSILLKSRDQASKETKSPESVSEINMLKEENQILMNTRDIGLIKEQLAEVNMKIEALVMLVDVKDEMQKLLKDKLVKKEF